MNRERWLAGFLALVLAVPLTVAAQAVLPSAGGTASFVSSSAVAQSTLGQTLSMSKLILTQNEDTEDSLVLAGGRLRLFPAADVGNAYLFYDLQTQSIATPLGFSIGANAPLRADALYSRNGGQPVAIGEAYGFRIACQSALPGQCGSGTVLQGTMSTLCATNTSRTRICTCTGASASGPPFAWALAGGAGAVGTDTTCPQVTP